MDARVQRFLATDQGTLGSLSLSGEVFCSLELPWRKNKQNISRIPEGKYRAVPHKSPKFGACYHVLNVPDRSWILFHSGNFAGDKEKGFKSDSSGCILLGESFGMLNNQMAVLQSRVAMLRFLDITDGNDISLIIDDIWLS
jgi:hypothetical protein